MEKVGEAAGTVPMVTNYMVCEDRERVLFVPLGHGYLLVSDAERALDALRSAHPQAYIAVVQMRPIAKH